MAKIKSGFSITKIGNETIIVAQGAAYVDYSKVISLNESGEYLWKNIEGKDFTPADLSALLMEKYDVEKEQADADALAFYQAMEKADII